MTLRLWQIDAFASEILEGNPAAVVPLERWLDDGLMQKIAGENNLAETAFFVKTAPGHYDLRWFTPTAEVDLCGHATLASAWLIFDRLESNQSELRFMTRSGELVVARGAGARHVMSLPSDFATPYISPANVAEQIGEALGAPPPADLLKGVNLIAVWDDPAIVRGLKGPGTIARVLYDLGIWGLIVTAPGDTNYDFVSRFFAPGNGVPEDPVTGSAHCALTPYWSHRLGKKHLKARQVSPRGGDILCTDNGARTILEGSCALYLEGQITL